MCKLKLPYNVDSRSLLNLSLHLHLSFQINRSLGTAPNTLYTQVKVKVCSSTAEPSFLCHFDLDFGL